MLFRQLTQDERQALYSAIDLAVDESLPSRELLALGTLERLLDDRLIRVRVHVPE